MEDVKCTRRYDSSRRRAQAERSREAVLDAASRQFLDHGYASTTVAAIAREAQVSVETIHKQFGGKSGLVRALYERGLTGRGATPAYERSDAMRASETDPRKILHNWGELTAEVAAELTPIRLLIRAAAASAPEMSSLLADADAERLQRMRHHALFLAERGYLRADVSPPEAADVLWMCSSLEIYELLVLGRGWSALRFARFLGELMISALLPESPADPSPV